MNTKEAIQAMFEGKKVTTAELNGTYMVFSDNKGFVDASSAVYDISDFIDEIWEIYEEPKLKQIVVIEKWLFDDRFGIECVLDISRDTLECYCHEFQMTKIKRLETYEVKL